MTNIFSFQQVFDSTYGNCYVFNFGTNPKIALRPGMLEGKTIQLNCLRIRIYSTYFTRA